MAVGCWNGRHCGSVPCECDDTEEEPMLEVPRQPEHLHLPCPGCEIATRPIRDAAVSLITNSGPWNPEEVLVECMTSGCPHFGSRWKYGELRLILEGQETPDIFRPSWDDQFLEIARITARRATCDRSHVGCVLVVDSRIVSSGYNGAFAGADHCDQVGHYMVDGRCARTVHAEANAVADAARRGVSVKGGTAYLTRLPCTPCLKLLISAGIVRIVCAEVLKPQYIEEAEWFAREAGIALEYPDPGSG
jgi:dCMP deaminase